MPKAHLLYAFGITVAITFIVVGYVRLERPEEEPPLPNHNFFLAAGLLVLAASPTLLDTEGKFHKSIILGLPEEG